MARSIVFVNASGAPWVLDRLGGMSVPALGTLDVTDLVTDDELVREIQKGLYADFDANHYLRVGGVNKSATESANFMTPAQAGGSAQLQSDGSIDDTQHGTRGGGTQHAVATPALTGFEALTDKSKLDGVSPNAARIQNYQFGRSTQVPGAGTLQLLGPGDTTVPARVNQAGTIVGASIQVDVVDASRAYQLEVHKNGGSVATVALAVSTLGNARSDLAVAVAVGDLISTFVVQTAGSGASTFSNLHAMVEVKY